MDPLSAIGLASNILQFIEFGTDLCGKIYEVAGSTTGLTEENAHLSEIVEDLKRVTDGLSTSLKGNNKHEVKLAKHAAECRDLSAELMGIISKLRIKKGDRLWSSERKVSQIEKRLTEYRAQIILRLNVMLYDEQSPISEHLKRIEQQAIDLDNHHGTELKTQHDQLKEIIQRLESMHINNLQQPSSATYLNSMQDIRTSLSVLVSSARDIPRENEILRALYFPSMFRRDDTIGPVVGDTYRWLVGADDRSDKSTDEENTDEESDDGSNNAASTRSHAENTAEVVSQQITDLKEHDVDYQELQASPFIMGGEHRERKDGEARSFDKAASRFLHFLLHDYSVFFIYGKAESGKSTLIKYLADSDNVAVRQILGEWAKGRRLRSLEGLYRSILFQALTQCPELATNLFEHAPVFSEWQEVRLSLLKKSMVRPIESLDTERYTLCLFIDGLDEYEGDSVDQAELEYMQHFTNQQRSIPLHDYTKGDILEYAITNFRDSPASSHFHEVSSLFALAKEIVTIADGVFLWAYLTARSFSQKMHIYTMERLQEIVDPLTCARTEKFLILAAHNPTYYGLNALSFFWMDDLDNLKFPFENLMCSYSNAEIEQRLSLVQKQLRDLTKGMLEVQPWESISYRHDNLSRHPFFANRMGFFHRTFRDYLLDQWHDKVLLTVEIYVRIALAGVKFSCSMDFYGKAGRPWPRFLNLVIIEGTFIWVGQEKAPLPDHYYKEMNIVFDGYEKLLSLSSQDQQNTSSITTVVEPLMLCEAKARICRPFSFLIYLAWVAPTSSYFIQRIIEFPNTHRLHDHLIQGVTPASSLAFWLEREHQTVESLTVPVWLAILASTTMSTIANLRADSGLWGIHYWQMIETLLECGADPDIVFLVSLVYSGLDDEEGIRYMDILQLIELNQPANMQSLRRLIGCPTFKIGQWWNSTTNISLMWFSHRKPDYAEETAQTV
ncbi:hypothetical protein BDW74DRAFT_188097 [Aspergillus multicolor]|uniref:uncharacterized protein n=1 Tax=Aspergillus multicolor TaxID=41759 RepID=UPI003CCD26D8